MPYTNILGMINKIPNKEWQIMNEKGISLFKKNGYYYISYTDCNGRRKQKSTRCKYKPDAMIVLSEFSKFIADEHKVRSTPFSSFAMDFLNYADSNLSKVTANIYRQAFNHFIHICSDMDIRKINPKHWDDYKTSRIQEKIGIVLYF